MRRRRALLTLPVLLSALVVSGCAGSGDGADAPAGSAASSRPAKPLMLGNERYVSPCRLMTPDDVASLVPDLGPYASFTQDVVETGRTPAQMEAVDGTLGGAVRTSCSYFEDDDSVDVLQLDVDQYISTASAAGAWQDTKDLGDGKLSRRARADKAPGADELAKLAKEAENKDGGFVVPGLGPSILYVPGRRQFVGHRGNLRLTLTAEGALGKNESGVRTLFAEIYDHAARLDRPSQPQSPLPAAWQQVEGWPRFIDPCTAFDATAMERSTGHRGDGTAEVGSTFREPAVRVRRNPDSPAFQSVSNKCARTASVGDDSWTASAEFYYLPPGGNEDRLLDTLPIKEVFPPGPLQAKYVAQNLVTAGVLHAVRVPGADRAWFLDLTTKNVRESWVMAARGDVVVLFRGLRPGGDEEDPPLTRAEAMAGVARVVANLG